MTTHTAPGPGSRRSPRQTGPDPLAAPVIVLGVLGAGAVVLPLVGLGTRVPWEDLPSLLASGPARAALGLSLRTCVVSTMISVVLGVPVALLLARDWPGVRVARVLVVLPMTMPPVVAGVALLATLGRRGLAGPVLEAVGLRVPFTTAAVVIAQVFVSMPYLVVTLEAALRSRDPRPETVARTLGAGPWALLVRITLPLVGPALARGTALALGRALGEFGATIAFAGSKEGVTRTMPLAIYLERDSDTATSLALATVLIALSFLVVATTTIRWGTIMRLTGRRAGPAGLGDQEAPAGPARPGPRTPTADEAALPLHIAFCDVERGVSVDLTVPAGRVLALVGPNGSGKSTVCDVAAGLRDAGAGEVRLGRRLLDGPGVVVPAGRRGIALLSQDPGVFPHMSVLANVAFGPRCRGASRSCARERAMAELEAVGAAHLAGRAGSELSGGQAARIALARALATDPRALVLDEPMAALDVTARTQMRALVARRAQAESLTVLLVTHDVIDVASLADDIAVLEAGRVVESGPVPDVLSAPSSRFGASLTGTSVLSGSLEGRGTAPRLRLPSDVVLAGAPLPPQQADRTENRQAAPDELLQGPGVALVPPEAVALYPPEAGTPEGSPRNVLAGTVVSVERAGGLATIDLDVGGGQRLSARVTAAALGELGAGVGRELTCVVKAVQVRILTRSPIITSQEEPWPHPR